jgi:hypothetical protein
MHSNDGELAVLTAVAKPRLARVAVTALATRLACSSPGAS